MSSPIRQFMASARHDGRSEEWLQELVLALTLPERHALSVLISKQNDPLRRFPSEITMAIFDHLPLDVAWSLRLVCSSWREILSSSDFLRPLLARWESHAPEDSARLFPTTATPPTSTSFHARLRHMLHMRRGTRFSAKTLLRTPADGESPHKFARPATQLTSLIALKGHRLAYFDSSDVEGDTLQVHDLIHHTSFSVVPTAREGIKCIALTAELIAFLTYGGKLGVRSTAAADSTLRTVRMPSANFVAFSADRNVVGIVILDSYSGPSLTALLLLYNFHSGRLIQHPLTCPRILETDGKMSYIRPDSILLDADAQTADIFYRFYDHRFYDHLAESNNIGPHGTPPLKVEHRRYSICTGALISSASQTCYGSEVLSIPAPTGYRDEFCLVVLETALDTFTTLLFDRRKAKFRTRLLPLLDNTCAIIPRAYSHGLVAVWKDLVFSSQSGQYISVYIDDQDALDSNDGRHTACDKLELQGASTTNTIGNTRISTPSYHITPLPEGNDDAHISSLGVPRLLVNDSFIVAHGQVEASRPQGLGKVIVFRV